MDALSKPPSRGVPIVFSGYEIQECYDRRGKFHLSALRRQQWEKAMQAILAEHHNLLVEWPGDVYHHVTYLDFSLKKAKRMGPACYLMTIEYRYQGRAWQHVFRYQRSGRGVDGILRTHERLPLMGA